VFKDPECRSVLDASNAIQEFQLDKDMLDWGASGAILRKDRILEFLNEMDLSERELEPAENSLKELTDGSEYVLFAWEG
jgi:hypothetical protein